MNKEFDIQTDVPDELWSLVDLSDADGSRLAEQLRTFERGVIVSLFRAFIEAKTEMADRLLLLGRLGDASEDTVEDISDALVVLGKETFSGVYDGRLQLPPRETWEGLPTATSAFVEVFDERFGGDIFDEIEDLC